MRAALARVRDTDEVGLAVGSDEVSLSRGGDSVVERKVALPVRWLKGFVEVQAYQARMVRKLEVSGLEAARFFRSLPKGSATTSGWVVASGRGLRLSQLAASGGVRIGGVQRLHILDDLARHAKALRIYADERNQASAWELVLDEVRFTLALSPDVSRGFSGEGQLLTELAARRWEETLPRVQASLKWSTRIEPDALAAACTFDRETITAALGVLGARGLVGYDLAEGPYFHRELPFDLEQVEALQPRLLDARKLVGSGGVRIERNDATTGQVEAAVRGTEADRAKLGSVAVARLRALGKGIMPQLSAVMDMNLDPQIRAMIPMGHPQIAHYRAARASVLATASFSQWKSVRGHGLPSNELTLRILRDRHPPWLDELVELVCEADDQFSPRWPLIRGLVREGLCCPPPERTLHRPDAEYSSG
jgi:hypothetical protein